MSCCPGVGQRAFGLCPRCHELCTQSPFLPACPQASPQEAAHRSRQEPSLPRTEDAGTPGAMKPQGKQPVLGAHWALPGSARPCCVTLGRAALLWSSLATSRGVGLGGCQGLPHTSVSVRPRAPMHMPGHQLLTTSLGHGLRIYSVIFFTKFQI